MFTNVAYYKCYTLQLEKTLTILVSLTMTIICATKFLSCICFLLIFLPAPLPIYSPFQYSQFLVNQSVRLVYNPTIPPPLLDGMVSHGSLSHQTWNRLCLNVRPHEQGQLDHVDPCLKIKAK